MLLALINSKRLCNTSDSCYDNHRQKRGKIKRIWEDPFVTAKTYSNGTCILKPWMVIKSDPQILLPYKDITIEGHVSTKGPTTLLELM